MIRICGQIYIHPDWNRSEALIRKAEKLGYKAIILTVDTTILGKREVDMRAAAAVSGVSLPFAFNFASEWALKSNNCAGRR